MIHKHDDSPSSDSILCCILHQKVYFSENEPTIDLYTSESFSITPNELTRKMQEISKQNIANKAFALEMGDSYYIQRILIKN